MNNDSECSEMKGVLLAKELSSLIRVIDSIKVSIPTNAILLVNHLLLVANKRTNFFEKYGKKTADNKYYVDIQHIDPLAKFGREIDRTKTAIEIIPESLFVTTISQFDAYLASTVKSILAGRPEVLRNGEKLISYESLLAFKSLDDAKNYVIQNEIDMLMRDSHIEQLKWIEKKFNTKIIENLLKKEDFIEATERRNLFVHCDGFASKQYIDNCERHKISLDAGICLGSRVPLEDEYIARACDSIIITATQITHFLWRKMFPAELKDADNSLNSICYDFIKNEEYALAESLLNFAVSLGKYSSEMSRRYFVVNYALSKKFQDKHDDANRILSAEDWSLVDDRFNLVLHSIKGDFYKAIEIMKRHGKCGPIEEAEYLHWPAFYWLRKESEFAEVYESIYGKKYEILSDEELTTGSVRAQYIDAIKNNGAMIVPENEAKEYEVEQQ